MAGPAGKAGTVQNFFDGGAERPVAMSNEDAESCVLYSDRRHFDFEDLAATTAPQGHPFSAESPAVQTQTRRTGGTTYNHQNLARIE
jgi:hypothetical protein